MAFELGLSEATAKVRRLANVRGLTRSWEIQLPVTPARIATIRISLDLAFNHTKFREFDSYEHLARCESLTRILLER